MSEIETKEKINRTRHDPMRDENKTSPKTSTAVLPTPEVVYVDKHRIACDGGGGALGHPKVWYSLEDGEATCGYCGRHFIYAPEKVV